MKNLKTQLGIILLFSFVALSAQAGPTADPIAAAFAQVQLEIQKITTQLSDQAKEWIKQQNKDIGEVASNAMPENVKKSEAEVESTDSTPLAEKITASELEKETPSVPAVQSIIKRDMLVDNKTLYQSGGITEVDKNDRFEDKSAQEALAKNTQEFMSRNVHMTLEQGRALAQKVLDLEAANRTKESQKTSSDINSRDTHTKFEKGNAALTQYVNSILNEILVLRASSLEIDAIQQIQSKQKAVTLTPKKN